MSPSRGIREAAALAPWSAPRPQPPRRPKRAAGWRRLLPRDAALVALALVSASRLRAASAAGTFEEDLRADKRSDAWTTTTEFKRDLLELFPGSKGETVLELGAHVGHCTRVLSRLFGAVIAVEHSQAVLDTNVNRTSDLGNIVHLSFHTVMDDWSLFSRGRIGVVFIDAAHDYHSVKSDIVRSVAMPTVHTLVLDDYGAERGVKTAVAEAVAEGIVKVRRHIGAAPPWSFSGRTIDEWEGIVLDPVRGSASSAHTTRISSLAGTTWVVFPAGVFVSGYFQPHGKVVFEAAGEASSSYGVIAWREAVEYADAGAEPGSIYVLQLEEEPRWRAEMQMNGHRTAAILTRDDGHQLVMLREEMMRTVGEKLLSFMH